MSAPRFETILPELRETSRARERFVGLVFVTVIASLLALVLGWGWALQSLRFEVEVPVSGRVVGVAEDGALRLELRLDAAADRRIDERFGSRAARREPRPGDVLRIRTPDAPGSVLEGEVVRVEENRIEAIARSLDSPTERRSVGTRVEGSWLAGSTSGFDLFRRTGKVVGNVADSTGQ